MFSVLWATPFGTLESLLGLVTFVLLLRSGSLRAYWPLLYIAFGQTIPTLVYYWLRTYQPFSPGACYQIFFDVYWITFACEALCSVLLTYTIFNETLIPLKGLQSLGRIMYRWVLSISCAVTLSAAVSASHTGDARIIRIVSEMTRLSGIIVLCLVLFVGFTIKPLGLSLRSRTFGVSLGLVIPVIGNILLAGNLFTRRTMADRYDTVLATTRVLAQLIWIWYFSVPEPQRKMLLLPTTSPFHAWNAVSERMGYDPGYVAIGGVDPAALADAERHIFERIAEQDNGLAPRLTEVSSETVLPLGWTSETENATARFNKVWNMRYGSPGKLPGADVQPMPPDRQAKVSQ